MESNGYPRGPIKLPVFAFRLALNAFNTINALDNRSQVCYRQRRSLITFRQTYPYEKLKGEPHHVLPRSLMPLGDEFARLRVYRVNLLNDSDASIGPSLGSQIANPVHVDDLPFVGFGLS